jgi:formamidopyrimidine-DNA glycosylase
MPELPEVESIARTLREGINAPTLVGQRITHATLRWPRHIEVPAPSTFRRKIRQRVISSVGRRGKYLVFELDQGTLLVHLRMSGDLYVKQKTDARGRFEHTVLHLTNGWEIRFSDARKFGKIFLLKDASEVLDKLGPEPLAPEFTAKSLGARLKEKKRIIKPLLMDQSFIAGIGNIYADEALYLSKIHPKAHSHQLSQLEISNLWGGIRSALQEGIKNNGASIDWVYRGGEHQNHFRVYQRTGKPCLRCETPIERITLGQRGTHFCPSCQSEQANEA